MYFLALDFSFLFNFLGKWEIMSKTSLLLKPAGEKFGEE